MKIISALRTAVNLPCKFMTDAHSLSCLSQLQQYILILELGSSDLAWTDVIACD